MHTPIVIVRARAFALTLAAVVALVCVAAFAESTRPVTYMPAVDVDAAFGKGAALVETDRYKVHASRREAPGKAEVHVNDTDIVYVLGGSATVVTGGAVIDGASIAPDEIRGLGIRGGTEQQLAKGDVLIVPAGVPHQFTLVSNPFLYYVVKTTDGGRR